MTFKKTVLALAATVALFGVSTVSAHAATIQALPNQTETQAAHDAVNAASDSETSSATSTTTNSAATSTSADTTSTSTTSTSATSSTTKKVVALAKQLATENIPYVWGGESLKGMDCSGLTDYVYQHAAGITLGHYTVTQESKVTKEAVSDAQPGDLLFWGSQGASYHVALYIGNNQYVAAPEPGEDVQIQTISSYFMPSFAGKVNA
ncbi:glycoside hydrolase [Secundilactobacillus paracollinoides]|uniref:C40 family peptidase n=2 Tax=Secundilactobacillus paracollinoides TaxID=240427 RepID=UPI0006D1DE53|nr:C40 family peptidase [Secundilactobacillus paracollinoides]ANZ64258.1 glycoside hydrolase [Secundilactobacillus paracollinoides]KRL75401.1 NlpC P60 family protein [Secundilactobacillus paracollinoides DSM 15502 = JCM 11969]